MVGDSNCTDLGVHMLGPVLTAGVGSSPAGTPHTPLCCDRVHAQCGPHYPPKTPCSRGALQRGTELRTRRFPGHTLHPGRMQCLSGLRRLHERRSTSSHTPGGRRLLRCRTWRSAGARPTPRTLCPGLCPACPSAALQALGSSSWSNSTRGVAARSCTLNVGVAARSCTLNPGVAARF